MSVGNTAFEIELRGQALDHLARRWGYESWRAFATADLESGGVGGSRAVFDIVRLALDGITPQIVALHAEVERLTGRSILRDAAGPHSPDDCAAMDAEMENAHGEIAEVLNFLHRSGYDIHASQRLIASVLPAVKRKESE